MFNRYWLQLRYGVATVVSWFLIRNRTTATRCVCVKTKVSDEEPVTFDTGYLHSWGSRVTGLNIRHHYTSSLGSRVHFPRALLAAHYADTDLFQFVSTLAVNPFTWGFSPGQHVTSELVRVAFAFVNGTYLALTGLRPGSSIDVQLTSPAASSPPPPAAAAAAADLDNVAAVQLGSNPVQLRPTESKFTLINASMLSADDVAVAAQLRVFGAASDSDHRPAANSSTVVSLDVFIGYSQVAHRYRYDVLETLPLIWNATSRRFELLRYLFLPLQ